MRCLIYISFFLLPLIGASQDYADKNYYLVDSIDLKGLTAPDRILLDSCLVLFHKSNQDTSKVIALNGICENMVSAYWVKYQFYQYQLINKAIKKQPQDKRLKKSLANALNNLGLIYRDEGDIEKALDYYTQSLKLLEVTNDKHGLADCLNNIGFLYKNKGELNNALDYYKRSLKIRTELNEKEGIALSLNNIGLLYLNQGLIKEALNYSLKSLKIREEIGDKNGIAQSLNNIGMLYNNQGSIEEALNYYSQSLKLYEELGDKKGIAFSLNNVGFILYNMGLNDKAKECYEKSLKLRKELGNKQGIAESLNNIGYIYIESDSNDLALRYFEQSLILQKESENKKGISNTLNNIGYIYFLNNNLNKALNYSKKSLEIANQIGFPESIKNAANNLSQIYQKQGNYKEAFNMKNLQIQMRDSINNDENQKATLLQHAKYEYEKQKALDDAEHEKTLAIEKESKAKQKIIIYSIAFGLLLVAIFLIFVINRLQVTRKQKELIEIQKKEVESAHHELEDKNQEITDSIRYAKRIQSAILPSNKTIKEYLPDSFILYKPKDIVAGDFYWMEHKEGRVLFAAADCTGHGVPGAMVSVVCNNGLNRSVREYGLKDPGEILNKTREIVIAEFEKSEEEVKDGMDIALCSLEGNTLKYAGANNPLWIIRNGEIIETKADKQPIGKFDELLPYTTHTFELQKGDTIYIFSDGYVDQFGGEKGKKFKTANFKKLLLTIQNESIEKQKQLINESFETWKGNLEQIDDVCVIGVKI
ncbi:tetratricopeptide repeat protein [Vicingus serpentipes]|uniref:Tetratricopeptide repeat protein n=1 Tax=Vicingus serpentipes TaxID=1926625 RepID=A0A5C6RRE9_9FLAO|nr:tetratricopeptide repeat protein [Vicingus serpentipes]TXB64833.1 tetratricopeptide repeat protein [Vicingus serpentipes]